jgi:Fructose-bisphosphate aldolase class-II
VTRFYRYLVFHGGSGSEKHEIKTAVDNGVVKMNVDTGNSFYHLFLYFSDLPADTQWAYLIGIRVSAILDVTFFDNGSRIVVIRTSSRRNMTTSKTKLVIPKVPTSPIRRCLYSHFYFIIGDH